MIEAYLKVKRALNETRCVMGLTVNYALGEGILMSGFRQKDDEI